MVILWLSMQRKHISWLWEARRQLLEGMKFLFKLGSKKYFQQELKNCLEHVCEDLKRKEHLVNNKQSLVRQLTSRINGLLKVCKRASKTTRLKVANGIFISKLCYLIQVWGGCPEYLLSALQVLQNRAARAVTKNPGSQQHVTFFPSASG